MRIENVQPINDLEIIKLLIDTDENGFWHPHPEWDGESMRCCDVVGCQSREPWHKMHVQGEGPYAVTVCDLHKEESSVQR